ncbi:MAG: bifunctional UDP-N-acetylglucosamine diphosphorylase/glucosamine-1-phosphate N-acetyltransferase GlmU [Clostridia bacterium]|nr:bifunctional UDP-N-acetylglucosamine diphosphorylase/glucosamine-1-phosphate N-acetyltransferase GlmU [Clostridia bacterium]
MSKNCAVILAAGEGKRMKSNKPKALAEVLFRPMIDWVLDAVRDSGIEDKILVVGHYGEQLESYVGDTCGICWQKERLGTGHAVMMALDYLKASDAENVLILNGDAPFMDRETIEKSLWLHEAQKNAVTVISAKLDDPTGYGRIVQDINGSFERIVEQKDATDSEKLIQNVNSGAYWFCREDLIRSLGKLTTDNEAHEYYLTDTIYILKQEGKNTGVYITENADVVLGANDRLQLQGLNEIARQKVMERHLMNGVDIPCPDGVIIGKDVVIGNETTILPNTILQGKTVIGSDCVLGPNTRVVDSTLGNGVQLDNILVEEAVLDNDIDIGPFSHIRPNTHLSDGIHIGNFVEVKNSNVGKGTKFPHLTYIGDADIGEACNFGCGSLIANYDGKEKHRTTVGDHVFVGCDTSLVAPVTLGNYVYTAAGSVVTEDVPDGDLAVARSRQKNLEGWVTKNKPLKGME